MKLTTNTDVSIRTSRRAGADVGTVAVFVPEKMIPSVYGEAAQRLVDAGIFRGKANEVVVELVDSGKVKALTLFLVGLGEAGKTTLSGLREAAGSLAKAVGRCRGKRVAVYTPGAAGLMLGGIPEVAAVEALVTGFLLGSFNFKECKGTADQSKDPAPGRREVTIITNGPEKAVRQTLDRARIIAEAQNFVRSVTLRPGNVINPISLAKLAQAVAKEAGITCRVMDEKQLARLGMNGVLAVGLGSQHPPRLMVLEYKPTGAKQRKPLLVVGKAITFDTGGISIKPAEKMQRMTNDKGGGAVVLGLMYAAARLRLPVHLVGILSSAENTLSERAYRPGDVVTMYNGVTVEVISTDAEGRLVLGDALAWGIETYKPAAVVDLATLTGGVIVALGKTMAGVMCNDDAMFADIQASADAAGEKLWRLPVWEEHRQQIKSDIADIANSAGREGAALTAGAFLSYFVPREPAVPWAHMDIAGVVDTEKDLPNYAKGATGWGVRTLMEWLTRRANGG